MKLRYLLALFLLTAICQAQNPVDPLYTPKYKSYSDSIQVANLNVLSKIAPEPDYDGASMPLCYNWTKDLRMMESIKRMSLDAYRLDAKGRALPIDIFKQVNNEVMFKSATKPN